MARFFKYCDNTTFLFQMDDIDCGIAILLEGEYSIMGEAYEGDQTFYVEMSPFILLKISNWELPFPSEQWLLYFCQ